MFSIRPFATFLPYRCGEENHKKHKGLK